MNRDDFYRFMTVGRRFGEYGHPANYHRGVNLPSYAASVSPNIARKGYTIDPHGYDPNSWFQDENGKWYYAGDPSYFTKTRATNNVVEFRDYGHGEGGRISPPGGWEQGAIERGPRSLGEPRASDWGNDPSMWADSPEPSSSPEDMWPSASPGGPQDNYNPWIDQLVHGGAPGEPDVASRLPTDLNYPGNTQEFSQSEQPDIYQPGNPESSNDIYTTGHTDYNNPPTNEAMSPLGPMEQYLPSPSPFDVPTNESMSPAPLEQYQPADTSNLFAPDVQSSSTSPMYNGGITPQPPIPNYGSLPMSNLSARPNMFTGITGSIGSMIHGLGEQMPTDMGGFGQPAGYFGIPQQNQPGSFGVGGEGGSYFGGSGSLDTPGSIPLGNMGGGTTSVAGMMSTNPTPMSGTDYNWFGYPGGINKPSYQSYLQNFPAVVNSGGGMSAGGRLPVKGQ
jgi:hypothetical protein